MLNFLNGNVTILRNTVGLAEIEALDPYRLVISPGPGAPPNDTGITCTAIHHFAGKIPILGVCLGHQAIGQVFGGTIGRASQVMHGKTSMITHQSDSIFAGLPNSFNVGRYHSLVIDRETCPDCLEITAISDDDNEIMAIRHRHIPNVVGVQFHPESILTIGSTNLDVHQGLGAKILANFLAL